MESPERGALMLVRFLALGLIGWAVAELSLYWLVCDHNHQPLAIFPCLVKSLPFVAGVVMLIKSRALAEWISEQLDL